ncbi:hypothetical protein TSUD_202990 [Trifolium subterraneum]|uniref:PB1-like domain-containing protein n=1 Tax=Trifolium subterraneum TaxID=3900 RepID=A0A2Z6M0H4_TRISU|nr:hypothetical protein TSUD_202990 [Trifolium subterraneum]
MYRQADKQEDKFRIHHGGNFVNSPVKKYVNGQVHEMENKLDVDWFSVLDLENIVKSLGYVDLKCMWYHHPKYSFVDGLRPFNNDSDFQKLVEDSKGYNTIDLYVEHSIDSPIVCLDRETPVIVDIDDEGPLLDEYGVDGVETEEVRVEEGLTESEDDEDYIANYGDENDDTDFDGDLVDEDWDWTHELPTETFVGNDATVYQRNTTQVEHEDVDNESDLQTPPESEDDEADNRKFPKYKIPENGDPVMMELGTEFDTKQQDVLTT